MASAATYAPEQLGLPTVREYAARVEGALAQVNTCAQARAACGACTERLSDGYGDIQTAIGPDYDQAWLAQMRTALDIDNARLYAAYLKIPNDGSSLWDSDAATNAWFEATPVIHQAYLDCYEITWNKRAMDRVTPFSWSPVDLLQQAIAAVGKALGDVAGSLGEAAGNAIGGAGAGIGRGIGELLLQSWPLLAVVGLGLWAYARHKGGLL